MKWKPLATLQTAGGMPPSREKAGSWHLGEVGGSACKPSFSWHRLCSHQRALPTRLQSLSDEAYQRPSCSIWPQLPNKTFIFKAFENKPCVVMAEMNF